ncbi:MAG TPA: hypothetical protein VN915_15470 [Elusimicrobiota bacterium]|nr:hypothetical protein [Elusimicrobiota bacterium]
MPRLPGRAVLAAGAASVLLVAALGVRALEPSAPDAPPRNENDAAVLTPEIAIRNWPQRPRLAARAMIEKYGAPDVFDQESMTWAGNRPWDETVVRRAAPAGESIQQSVHYPVTLAKLAQVRSLGGRIEYDPSNGELSSSSDVEGLNFLALNLADEVVSGKRSLPRARALYRRTRELTESGKSSPYTTGLLFSPRE